MITPQIDKALVRAKAYLGGGLRTPNTVKGRSC